MFLSKPLETIVHQGEAMGEILVNILQLNNGNAVFTSEGRRFILKTVNWILQAKKDGQMWLYLRVMRHQYLKHKEERKVKEVA